MKAWNPRSVLSAIISSRAMVTALRLALVFINLLSSIDPEKFHAVISNALNPQQAGPA
jgi:hypothetical protein